MSNSTLANRSQEPRSLRSDLEDPGAFVIYVKGWSEGEPIKSVEKGTYDILELGVFVSIRSTGNIVFAVDDRSEQVKPGECASYDIEVTKNFDSGELVFATPGAPEAKPDGVAMDAWRRELGGHG